MMSFVARRLAWSVAVLYVVVTATFFLMNAVGDPAIAQLGAHASAAQREEYRRSHGLNEPILKRYFHYIGSLAVADLGVSYRVDAPQVTTILAPRIPRTALVGLMSLLVEFCLGVALGILAAAKRNTWIDTGLMALAFFGTSLPTFILGIMFLNLVAFRLGWFPVGGYGVDPLDHLRHAVLPALTLGLVGAATNARMMRGDMIEALSADYVRTARAKGLAWPSVVIRHAARNALLSTVTLVGMSLPILVSGAIVTESVFGWPGIGRLSVEAISTGDTPVVMAIVILASIAVLAGNLLADIANAWLDPRTRDRAKNP